VKFMVFVKNKYKYANKRLKIYFGMKKERCFIQRCLGCPSNLRGMCHAISYLCFLYQRNQTNEISGPHPTWSLIGLKS
jgi:hypothetical protein